jgi:Flp pilus assembly pilin Flp
MILYIVTKITNALHDRKGVSSLEYGVLAVAVIGAVGLGASVLSTDIGLMFGAITSKLSANGAG